MLLLDPSDESLFPCFKRLRETKGVDAEEGVGLVKLAKGRAKNGCSFRQPLFAIGLNLVQDGLLEVVAVVIWKVKVIEADLKWMPCCR